jgi:mxaJ protein
MAFSMAMGVRKGDTALRDALDGFIARHASEIERILDAYGVPRLSLPSPAVGGAP